MCRLMALNILMMTQLLWKTKLLWMKLNPKKMLFLSAHLQIKRIKLPNSEALECGLTTGMEKSEKFPKLSNFLKVSRY